MKFSVIVIRTFSFTKVEYLRSSFYIFRPKFIPGMFTYFLRWAQIMFAILDLLHQPAKGHKRKCWRGRTSWAARWLSHLRLVLVPLAPFVHELHAVCFLPQQRDLFELSTIPLWLEGIPFMRRKWAMTRQTLTNSMARSCCRDLCLDVSALLRTRRADTSRQEDRSFIGGL